VEFADGTKILSMSNNELVFVNHNVQLPLNKLHWQCYGVEKTPDGCEKATFVAIIIDQTSGNDVLKLTKTFSIIPGSYMVKCDVNIENLSSSEKEIRFNLTGPIGCDREDVRSDMRGVVAVFKDQKGRIVSNKKVGINKLRKAKTVDELRLERENCHWLWAAVTNKYFGAILVPVADDGKEFCDWAAENYGRFYNPDGDAKSNSGDETIGIDMRISAVTLAAAGTDTSSKNYRFELYLGPKDKKLFDSNELYRKLGFVHSIDFLACCCPAGIIRPLAFFIMGLMTGLYTYISNYGVVIIILVFIVRILLHPLTKAGQVRMSKFTKIMSSPEMQEIKKQYGNNKIQMQKKMSEFYKSRGASPADMLFGMLPMFVQMPLWVALWSSINSSIDLRGAGFLPFWITDLSVPDCLFKFPGNIDLPILGTCFNLLPILMGVAFYLQQQMTPQQPSATAEQAQQQKMMKLMMLVMFPVMLYKAPSGVSLYIMSSSFAGAIEQYVIRKHIREKEQEQSRSMVEVTSKTGGKVKKKKPKPFFKY